MNDCTASSALQVRSSGWSGLRFTAVATVNSVLAEMARRQVLADVRFGKLRVGRMLHSIRWQHSGTYRLALDLDACAVTLLSLLPVRSAPSVSRDLHRFLRECPVSGPDAEDRFDTARGELRVFNSRGALTLSVMVKDETYDYCTRSLLCLSEQALAHFSGRPAAV